MVTEVSTTEFQQGAGRLLQQVQDSNDSVIVRQDGKPIAVLVAAELFERIRRVQERFDTVGRRIAEAHATTPEAEGIAVIDDLVFRNRVR